MVGVACYIVGWADAADSRADGQVIELKGRVTALEAAAASGFWTDMLLKALDVQVIELKHSGRTSCWAEGLWIDRLLS